MYTSRTCPYLDRGDGRCADRLTLEGLPEAFEYCVGDYEDCVTYHQIGLEGQIPPVVARQVCSA